MTNGNETLTFRVSNKVGYVNALEKVIARRLSKKATFNDSFKQLNDWEIFERIKEESKMLGLLIEDSTQRNKHPDKEVEHLLDLINFSLFMLENKLAEQNK